MDAKHKVIGLSVITATLLFTGCATTELQTSAKMTQSIFINPVSKDKRTVFVNMKNTSGQNINLYAKVEGELKAKGYSVIDDPEVATYVLMTNVLYCDKKRENNTAQGIAPGAVGGAIIGAATANRSGQGTAGAVGGLIGGAVGGLIAKATEDTIYQMQVDIVIREKAKGKVNTTTGSKSGQASVTDSKKAGFADSFAGAIRSEDASGKLNSNTAQINSQSYETDYIEQKTMMFAEATKMDLKIEDAVPVLEGKIATQIAGLF